MVILERGGEPIPGYFLAEKLGEGSFGVVWSADGPGQTRVALKFLDLHRAGGLKEFEAVSAIKNIRHPNLLPVTGYWLLDSSGTPIRDGQTVPCRLTSCEPATLVIAMVAGEKSLDDVLRDHQSCGRRGIPLPELMEYVEDAARGLDFLNATRHDLGDGRLVSIQHRDIKPDNILLVGDVAVLCDFGVARASCLQSVRSTGMIGSPAFISPESIMGTASGGASDQYSLALTYYYLRTGQHAVQAMNQASAIHCHVTGALNFGLIDGDERVVLQRATSLEATSRFESCREMVRAIRRAVAQMPPCVEASSHASVTYADTTATEVDPRFHSTTAAEERARPSTAVVRSGSWRRGKINQRRRLGRRRSQAGRGHLLRRLLVSTSLVTLAAISIQFVSQGPRAHANSGIERRPARASDAGLDAWAIGVEDRSDCDPTESTGMAVLQETLVVASPPVEERPTVGLPSGPELESPDVAAQKAETDGDFPMADADVDQAGTDQAGTGDPGVLESSEGSSPPVEAELPTAEERAIEALIKLGASFDFEHGELDLSQTKVTREDLAQLADLPELSSLSLENTGIDDEAIAIIVDGQPNLRSLYLAGTNVTDAGLGHLAGLKSLVRLDLASCDVHDGGLVDLYVLDNLVALGLRSTRVSRAGMYALSEAFSHRAVIQGPQFNLLGGKRFEIAD